MDNVTETIHSTKTTDYQTTLPFFNLQEMSTLGGGNIENVTETINSTNATDYVYQTTLPFFIFDIIPPLVVSIGVVGNILTLFVLSRKPFARLSVSVYLRGLAIADFFALLISDSFLYLLEETTTNYIRDSEGWACKIFIWLHSSMPWISSWLVVSISIERAIVVLIPHKAKKLCTATKSKIVTAFIYIFCLVGNSHAFFKYDIYEDYCDPDPEVEIYYIALLGIAIAVYTVLPLLIIVTCNVLIIVTLVKMSKLHDSMSQSSAHGSASLTIMLVVNCVFFLLSTVPYNILIVIFQYFLPQTELANFMMDICYELRFSNHAINFFLYVICGSLFRRELILMLKCVKSEQVSVQRSTASTVQTHIEMEKY